MDDAIYNFIDRIEQNKKGVDASFYTKIEQILNKPEYKLIYKLSKYANNFVKNANVEDVETISLVKNIAKRYIKDEYLLNAIKPSYIGIAKFKRLLEKHNMYDSFLVKEFGCSAGVLILYTHFYKFENLELFESIRILWIIVDNIIDRGKNKRVLKPLTAYLKRRIYNLPEEEEKKFLFKYKDNICIQVIMDIKNNKKLINKQDFFEDTRTLFMYSYTKKGIKNENSANDYYSILKVALEKSYLSHMMFSHCLEKQTIEPKELYYLCLLTQIGDDLLDIREDLINDGNTIFTIETRKNRSIITITLIQCIIEKFKTLRDYGLISIINSVFYNRNLLDQDFVKELGELKIIDSVVYDLKFIEDFLVDNKISEYLDINLINKYDREVEHMDDEEIIEKVQIIANSTYI